MGKTGKIEREQRKSCNPQCIVLQSAIPIIEEVIFMACGKKSCGMKKKTAKKKTAKKK